VQVRQGIHHLADPGQSGGLGQRALPLDDLLQVFPFHVVHHQVLSTRARIDEVVADTGQVGVGQAGQDAGLLPELGLGRRAGLEVLLDGHAHS